MPQLTEILDRRAEVEHRRFADIGVLADADRVEVKAVAERGAAVRHDGPGDDGVVADAEQVRGDGKQRRADDRIAADPRAERAEEDVEQRRTGEGVGGRRADNEAGEPEAEVREAPKRDGSRPGAAEQQPFRCNREDIVAEEPDRDDGERPPVERGRRMDRGMGPCEARLGEKDGERPGAEIDPRLRRATETKGGERGSVLGRRLPGRRGDGFGTVDRASEAAHTGIGVDVAHGDRRFRR